MRAEVDRGRVISRIDKNTRNTVFSKVFLEL